MQGRPITRILFPVSQATRLPNSFKMLNDYFKRFSDLDNTAHDEMCSAIVSHISALDEYVFDHIKFLLDQETITISDFIKDIYVILNKLTQDQHYVIALAIPLRPRDVISFCLSRPEFNHYLFEAFKTSAILRRDHFVMCMQLCAERNNAIILTLFKNHFPTFVSEYLAALNDEQRNIIQELLNIDAELQFSITNLMLHFHKEFHPLDVNDAALVCARIAAKSKAPFNPTILLPHEVSDYFAILKSAVYPRRERIVVTGSHWIAADIQINTDGKLAIFISDSLGMGSSSVYRGSEIVVMLIDMCVRTFPELEVFVSQTVRQHTQNCCYIFALHDVSLFFKVDDYLPPSGDGARGLFNYLADKNNVLAEKSFYPNQPHDITIKLCRLPLIMLQTMQSTDVYTDLVKRDPLEIAMPINHRGETLSEVLAKNFVPTSTLPNVSARNQRLLSKFGLMGKRNREYLLTHSDAVRNMEARMQTFKLAGFSERIEQENKATNHSGFPRPRARY